ncbi:glycerol-3-phosphate 1-O-acyltransferase PlsB [Pelagibaculum spongiae]|uniref:Glycerol-3-phosphate acyltransferase n=1 Tax=Pelagibaculum spongiae TaxID=2080658 RepID=A0A2V1GVX3_9GAMM|nr:glycerol-3-phosphate 1-O-acyltransferase PlsB [Pelagibaculum spongiae]PVZ69484.1 glycerol-3-phosphate 1-O-acyltransferase [Pelagibaculum spongiae]
MELNVLDQLRKSLIRLVRKPLAFWANSRIMPEKLQNLELDTDKPVCYVMRDDSISNQLLLEDFCLSNNLPSPLARVSDQAGTDGVPPMEACFCLGQRGKGTQPGVPDDLIKLQGWLRDHPEQDIQLVPVSVLWGRNPGHEKSIIKLILSDRVEMGWGRRLLVMLLHMRQCFMFIGKPVSLRSQLTSEDDRKIAHKLSRVFRVHFHRQRVSVLGPAVLHRPALVASVVRSDAVEQAIQYEITNKKISREKATANARKYVEEVAASYENWVVKLFDHFLRWLWNRLYSGVKVGNVDHLREKSQGHELVYVPTHRSHMDYLLLSYVLFYQGLATPYIAAGINLNIWPVGGLLRRGGAFFIRRSFRGNQLYTTVFKEYVHTMLKGGYAMEYFIEGGRSRTGRLLPPKTGMLAMTVQSYLRNSRKPIMMVPVYFGYERVVEGRTYIKELSGAAKQPESVKQLLKASKALKTSWGEVQVNFGDPIPLTDYLEQQKPGWRNEDYGNDPRPEWLSKATDGLAGEIMERINAAAGINGVALSSLALLATDRNAMSEHDLLAQLGLYQRFLKQVGYSEMQVNCDDSETELLGALIAQKGVGRFRHPQGDLIYLDSQAAVLMTYYRNNILHMFAVPALVAACFSHGKPMSRQQLLATSKSLYPFLKAELFISWSDAQLKQKLLQIADFLVTEKLLIEQADGLLIAPEQETVNYYRLMVLAQALAPTLERFYLVLLLLNRSAEGSGCKQLEDICQKSAQRLSVLIDLRSPEFFDKALFRQMFRTLREQGYLQETGGQIVASHGLDELHQLLAQMVSPAAARSIRQVAAVGSEPAKQLAA